MSRHLQNIKQHPKTGRTNDALGEKKDVGRFHVIKRKRYRSTFTNAWYLPSPKRRAHFIDTFQCRHLHYRIQTGANREHGINILARPACDRECIFFTCACAHRYVGRSRVNKKIIHLTLDVVKSGGELHDDVLDVARRIVAYELGPAEYRGDYGRLGLRKV